MHRVLWIFIREKRANQTDIFLALEAVARIRAASLSQTDPFELIWPEIFICVILTRLESVLSQSVGPRFAFVHKVGSMRPMVADMITDP